MKKLIALFLFALLMLAVSAAATTDVDVVVHEKLHKKFEIVLASNPTTGYGWQLDSKLDAKLLKLVGSRYSGPQSRLVGAGGQETWTFQAVGRGQSKLGLKYVRPWEKNAKPARTCIYEIVVK